MTNLATYTQIAELVKSWADKVEDAKRDAGSTYLPVALDNIAAEMRTFGNGLVATVDAFAPIIAEINKVVADDNVIEHNNQFGKRDNVIFTATWRDPIDHHTSPFAMHTASVAPGVEWVLQFPLPRLRSDLIEIKLRVRP